MTLIDGVGDEVVQFAVAVLLVVVGALAWWSTNARPDRYRTVLVVRSRTHHPVTVSIRTGPNLMVSNTQANSNNTQLSTMDASVSTSTSESVADEPRESRVIPLQEMDSIVDADMAMLDNHRLHFYRRIESPNSQPSLEAGESSEYTDDEPAGTEQIREMDSIVSAMEDDNPCEVFRTETNRNMPSTADKATYKSNDNKPDIASASNAHVNQDEIKVNAGDGDQSTSNTERILIKLKYLNDTLKEVDGSLDELLKDFKTRHFSTELSLSYRVRLIFNGRVLLDDAATLRACGLHDRCVVHCLVHPRPHNQGGGGGPEPAPLVRTELVSEGQPPERAWDLENVLMTLVSVALTVVWFFRCEYSNMFTASASVALFGLTVFYSVAIFGLYLSDTFHFDRRPQQPRANPVPDN